MAAIHNVTDEALKVGIQGSFSTLASTFFYSSLAHMIPWIAAMTAVVICDCISALRRCYLMKEKIAFSRMARDTMAKLVTYYSFVISVTMLTIASGGEYNIDQWLCILVCTVELFSIISNILKPMGYNIDFAAFISMVFGLFSKACKIEKDDINKVIKKEE